eukprot:UN20338
MNKILREDQSLVAILAGVNSCAFLPVVSYAVYDICYNGDPILVAQAIWAFFFRAFCGLLTRLPLSNEFTGSIYDWPEILWTSSGSKNSHKDLPFIYR